MSMSDPLGDMITRIRNAQRSRHAVCVAPASKMRASVLEALKREGEIVRAEVAADALATEAKTARLRALRMAREADLAAVAAEAQAATPPAKRKRKSA